MSEQFIVFTNQGEIDPVSIRTFGVSVKEGTNPIGYFGTGLKYALAIYMRLGHKVEIHSGLEVFKFSTRSLELREKGFRLVTMNDDLMPFTTELGKSWEPWQAFRELYCNCIDEQGEVTIVDSIPTPEKDVTRVIIRGREATLSYHDRANIVLKLSPDLLLTSEGVEVYNNPSHYLYYRGVRVLRLAKPAMFTYNVTETTELTEDRTLKFSSHVMAGIPTRVASITDKDIIRKALNADDSYQESLFCYDWLSFHSERCSAEFLEVLNEEYEFNSNKLNASARKFLMKKLDTEAALHYKPEDMNDIEKAQMDKCVKIITAIYPDFTDWKIMTVKSLGSQTMAVADDSKRAIVISKACFRHGTKYLLSTLIEEFFHLKSGYQDCTRNFQTYIFDNLSSLIETYVVKEPV